MKVSGRESNGPVLPVWQSVKGLSSKEPGCGSPPSPSGASIEGTSWRFLGNTSVFPSEAIPASPEPQPQQRRASRSSHLKLPPTCNELEVPCTDFDHPSFTSPYSLWGLSSSTTSTSLSNANFNFQGNEIAGTLGAKVVPVDQEDEALSEVDGPQAFRIRNNRIGSKKLRRRIVHKNGECNVTHTNVAKRRRRYLQDIFTTLVDIQWRWTLLVFAASFLMSWLTFALVWYGLCFMHGDLIPEHLPAKQEENGWSPCVVNMYSFTSSFLFSIETQHTIGYGSRYTTEECPEAIFILCLQSITGVMIQAFMVGIVFAKLSRPKKRTQTLMFSRNACVCQRDGELCLLFRVGDMRKSHIIEAHIRAQLIRRRETAEGEIIPFFQYELNVGYDIGEDRIFFIWPMTIVHKIDETSPLYDISAHDLLREKFEIVVMLEGVIESTGMTTQARSSYLPNEVLWGYRFEPLVFFKKDTGDFTVDYSLFNNTYQVTTPLCSARHLDQCRSRESSPVTPATPLTPLSPLTPLTPTSLSPEHKKGSASLNASISSVNLLATSNQPHQVDESREERKSNPKDSSSLNHKKIESPNSGSVVVSPTCSLRVSNRSDSKESVSLKRSDSKESVSLKSPQEQKQV